MFVPLWIWMSNLPLRVCNIPQTSPSQKSN
jgi:hypothetical protein